MDTTTQGPRLRDINIVPIKENIEVMVSTAWILTVTCLWPASNISVHEVSAAKKYIRRFIMHEADPYKAYLEYCQRTILAAKSLSKDTCCRFDGSPCAWFDKTNENGFAQTRKWFGEMQVARVNNPLYKHEMKAFCEAVLDMAEEPGYQNFQYWAAWFIPRGAYNECMLFLAWVARAGYYFDQR